MTFLHSGDLGDIIYALPTIRQLGGGKLYLANGHGKHGTRQPLTDQLIESLKPLLIAQPYISAVLPHKGEKVAYNFTGFRHIYEPKRTLAETQRIHVSPLQTVDFRTGWLTVTLDNRDIHDKPVIARSMRYRNPDWDGIWPDIREKYKKAIFVGTEEEHADFESRFGKIEHHKTTTLLDLAKVIAGGTNFIGNQSCPLAIAHGLRKAVIVEESKKQPDCRIVRDGARYIQNAKQWDLQVKPTKIMLALQFHPGDARDAIDLAQLIVDIEPEFNSYAEVAVCVTREVSGAIAETVRSIFAQKFKTHIIRSNRYGRGWPDGCNDLWQDSMFQLGELSRIRKTECNCVLTFEPDCIPGRADWINVLRAQWDEVKEEGKLAFGHVTSKGEPNAEHINGNMVLSIRAIEQFPQLIKSSGSWDMAHRKIFMANGIDSDAIIQFYAERRELSFEEVMSIRKNGQIPALIHGLKTACGRNAIRKALFQKVA